MWITSSMPESVIPCCSLTCCTQSGQCALRTTSNQQTAILNKTRMLVLCRKRGKDLYAKSLRERCRPFDRASYWVMIVDVTNRASESSPKFHGRSCTDAVKAITVYLSGEEVYHMPMTWPWQSRVRGVTAFIAALVHSRPMLLRCFEPHLKCWIHNKKN